MRCRGISHSVWVGSQNDKDSHTPLLLFGLLSSLWGDSLQLSISISESERTPGNRKTLCNIATADQVALPRCKPVGQWKCAAESWKMASGESVTEGEILCICAKYNFLPWKVVLQPFLSRNTLFIYCLYVGNRKRWMFSVDVKLKVKYQLKRTCWFISYQFCHYVSTL